MGIIGIVNLAERLLNQTSAQGQDSQTASRQVRQAGSEAPTRRAEDQFTPSRQNEGDAGLFQVTQFSFFSAAADFLLAQSAPPAANQTPPPAAQANATPAKQAAPVPAAAVPVSGSQVAPPAAVPANVPAAVTAAPANISVPTQSVAPVASNANPLASIQNQLQSLNNALLAPGLDPTQLAMIDRIAGLIKDFNPAAFTSLVQQLEALAQANLGTANGANLTGGGFQIQELAIKFTGVQETLNQSGANGQGAGTSVQLSAFNLQVEEVNLTLTNGNGQTAQIQAPQPAAALPALDTTPKVTAPPAAQANAQLPELSRADHPSAAKSLRGLFPRRLFLRHPRRGHSVARCFLTLLLESLSVFR